MSVLPSQRPRESPHASLTRSFEGRAAVQVDRANDAVIRIFEEDEAGRLNDLRSLIEALAGKSHRQAPRVGIEMTELGGVEEVLPVLDAQRTRPRLVGNLAVAACARSAAWGSLPACVPSHASRPDPVLLRDRSSDRASQSSSCRRSRARPAGRPRSAVPSTPPWAA